MPNAGGWLDQPNVYAEAMMHINKLDEAEKPAVTVRSIGKGAQISA